MDLFDTYDENENINNGFEVEENNIVLRRVKRNRKKCITYIEGWNKSIEELKEHLQVLKRKYGCNGAVKKTTEEVEGVKKEKIVFQLSGDMVEFVSSYLLENGIKQSELNIIG